MIKNYLKVAFRNLWINKGFSALNIIGLSIGMAAALLILLWTHDQMGTDRFYSNTERIYTMYNRYTVNGVASVSPITPAVMAGTLKRDFPEVEEVSRFNSVTFLVTSGEKHLNDRGSFADSSFLKIFDFPFKEGNASTALSGNNNIVITEGLALRLFGKEEAIGKIIKIDSIANFTVSAVLKDLPDNTMFSFDYILPWSYKTEIGWDGQNWNDNSVFTYVMLRQGASQATFDTKIKDLIAKHSSEATAHSFTHPISRQYLYSRNENGNLVGGRIDMVRMFIIIAVFILLIACINFMNLSTARSEKRSREVGIRKVMGARKGSLIGQFIGESVLLALIAFALALFFVELSLDGFNQLTGRRLFVDYYNAWNWLFAGSFILFTGIIAGSYPAFYLSAFNPTKVLKGTFKKMNLALSPRRVLVVVQFSFAIILIICTIIVERQIQYAKDRDRGYSKDNLVFTFVQGDIDQNYKLIRDGLLSNRAAVAVTRSASPITQRWLDDRGYSWDGATEADQKTNFVRMGTDIDFVKATGVTLLQGRDIDVYEYPSDTTAVLLNESAVKLMHFKDPIGQVIRHAHQPDAHVVGVVKDFILESPYERRPAPTLILGPRRFFEVMHIKLNPANSTADNLAKAEKVFKEFNPQFPFEYYFVDEAYAAKFADEERTGKLAALFAGLTIFISCLGLFGLATYMAESRIKEIGVRKVLGASVTGIVTLLSKDFLKPVLISVLIAAPVAWFMMNTWLQHFNYRVAISWWIFLVAGAIALLIAIATVSFQALRAALVNPAKCLRNE